MRDYQNRGGCKTHIGHGFRSFGGCRGDDSWCELKGAGGRSVANRDGGGVTAAFACGSCEGSEWCEPKAGTERRETGAGKLEAGRRGAGAERREAES